MALAMKNNGGFAEGIAMPERRAEFFKGHHSAKDLIGYMDKFVIREGWLQSSYRRIRSLLSKIKRRIMK